MKLLSIAVPCYNSTAYMRKCIESLLTGGEEVEILIVDDGSTKDNTLEVAKEYEEKYPTIVKAIHQENKGHGGAVNTGIANATGLYFKVCDSDDWYDEEAFRKLLNALRKISEGDTKVDVVITNYIYDKEASARPNYVMRYKKFMPEDRPFGWDEMKRIDAAHHVLMHSIAFRLDILKESGLKLPEHTFYVDNIYAYIPFAWVKTLYYCNADLYHYFIGRADQSVNEQIMLKRLPQQIHVNEIMIDFMGQAKDMRLEPRQRQFLRHSLAIIMMVSSVLMIRSGDKEVLKQKKALWDRLKDTDTKSYWKIRNGFQGLTMNLPGKGGRKIASKGYDIAQRIYGFD